MNKLAYFYGFSLPFTSAFALNPRLPIPALLGMLSLIMIFVTGFRGFLKFDFVVFLGFLVPVFISSIFNYPYIGEPTFITHILSYLFVFLVYYLVPREFLRYRWYPLLAGVSMGLLLSLLFGYFEFIFANLVDPYWLSFIPRADVSFYAPTFAGSIIRARSFVEESGHFALYLGVISPLVFIYKDFRFDKWNHRLFIFSVCIGLIITFSTSGIVFSILSAIFAIMTMKSPLSSKLLKFSLLITSVFLIYFTMLVFFDLDLSRLVTDKLATGNGRLQPLVNTYQYIVQSDTIHMFFGLGPGYYEYRGLTPAISLPATVAAGSGFLGLFCYIAMFVIALRRIRLFDTKYQPILIFTLVFSFLVYVGISNYWYPWLWFLFSFLSVGPRITQK